MNSNYIKGICVEFNDKLDGMTDNEIAYVKNKINTENSDMAREVLKEKELMKEFNELHGYYIEDFCEHDDVFQCFEDVGITHMFIHVWFKIDWRKDLDLGKPVNICLADPTGTNYEEEFDYNILFKKCQKHGIRPCIKIMNDHLMNNDMSTPCDPEIFFKEYKELTKKILSYDTGKILDIISIANETGIIRKFANCRKYFEDYISWLRKEYSYLRISMSQFVGDIKTGQLDICDLVDIIGVNYYPSCKCHNAKTYEDLIPYIYTNDIYVLQEYCKNNNKTFMISECGCSNWGEQYIEPEKGNSMVDFYNKEYNFIDQMNYLKASILTFKNMDYCVGFTILGFGGNYDPFFKHEYDSPLKNKKLNTETKEDTFEMIKSIWVGDCNE